VTPGGLRPPGEPDDRGDIIVARISPDGSRLVWSSRIDGHGVAVSRGHVEVDADGNVYVVGTASSPDFPTTPDALQPRHAGDSDAVFFVLSPDGTRLLYSTYLGGSGRDMGLGLARAGDGGILLAGWTRSPDFPVTEGAFQTRYAGHGDEPWGGDAWIARFSPDRRRLAYSTFYGGPGTDSSGGNDPLTVDAEGRAVLIGSASAAGVPIPAGALRRDPTPGREDLFAIKLSADGSSLAAGTLLGGTELLEPSGTAVDAEGRVYVAGRTRDGFPVTAGAFQPHYGGGRSDAFLSVLSPDLSALLYSTYLGGSGAGQESTRCLALRPGGGVWMSGDAGSQDFPRPSGGFGTFRGRTSAFGALWPGSIAAPGDPTAR
jgi:hypothetical protein